MEQIFKKMLDQSIKNLELLHNKGFLDYKISAVTGQQWGNLNIAELSRKRAAPSFPRGTVRGHIMPYIESLTPDNIVSIPLDKFKIEHLRGNICSWCTTHWGKGTYTTTYNREANCIEIYRHAV